MIKRILARTFVAAVVLAAACASANAFTCPAKVSKPLVPVNSTVKLKGVAEISDCFGNSFIYIKVTGRCPMARPTFPSSGASIRSSAQ